MIRKQSLLCLDLHNWSVILSGLSVNIGEKYDYTIIKGERFGSHMLYVEAHIFILET